ncbi:hypothetical protein H310_00880 [Aphanomyces invadans]|uniref:DNA damage-inducible protein 1 n=1 Tax=Aphanomyces invadans TaxID=157072 RepID=A0A024UQW0_9STRA|nr:hypothetical protein H310_00880 [Aphanomyces invadans]ETW08242.1 hypothetical protein H310_00880 [Aphanomyces invadans]|eukprot:XP_008862047.1 hypothetical protein H310_00880 [Aphanomyces invadans]
MQLTVGYEDTFIQVEVDAEEPVENIKALIEAQLGIPLSSQVLVLNGRPINPNGTVTQAGIQNHDLVLCTALQPPRLATAAPSPFSRAPASIQARAGMFMHDIPPNCTAELLIDIMRLNPQLLRQIEEGNPSLAQSLKSNDVAGVRMALMKQHMEIAARKYKEEQEALELERNPFSEEAQAKIEEAIRLGNVQQNMEIAMEEMPEAFGRVHMLYIPTMVNNTPVKAFVDSGAQSTIMSSNCAERCGIMRLVDRRYAGQAVGVGTAKIIGRVHMAPLKIGNVFYNCSFTILDQQGVDFLFGLDMLKRHQCSIDLHRNALVLRDGAGDHEVPFLPEHEIPVSEQSSLPPPSEAPATNATPPAAPTAASTSPTALPQSSASGGGLTPDQSAKVQQLVDMGFPNVQAVQVLASCNWDVNIAAGLLFES